MFLIFHFLLALVRTELTLHRRAACRSKPIQNYSKLSTLETWLQCYFAFLAHGKQQDGSFTTSRHSTTDWSIAIDDQEWIEDPKP